MGRKMSGQELIKAFDSSTSRDDVLRTLGDLNGFYAVSFRKGPFLYAAVDRVRSIPLYYSFTRDELVISDDPQWVQSLLGDFKLDPLSVAEFLLTGYVTGSATLDSRVRQLQAGELLIAEYRSGGIKVELVRYYRFEHGNYYDTSVKSLMENLDEVTLSAVQRLISYANGRQIAIPLSGGLDSRLIAMSLKRLGYNDVVAFSYGQQDNAESHTSRCVAEQLEIPWHFVEYTPEKWKRWYKSEQYANYVRFAEGLTSVAHCQDWPAVMQLVDKRVLREGAVIVPGHSADFVAGSHIPVEVKRMVDDSLRPVVMAIWEHHYNLNTRQLAAQYSGLKEHEVTEALQKKIATLLTGCSAGNIAEAVNAYEYWDWQERQAKFIVNSVRVYDFWGHDWWLPWWDAEFMFFWQSVPVKYRLGKGLYDRYVSWVQKTLGVKGFETMDKRSKQIAGGFLRKVGLLGPVLRVVLTLRHIMGRRRAYNHPLAWYGLIEPSSLSVFERHVTNINTILALDQIRRMQHHFVDAQAERLPCIRT